jgi:hypothetical protein
MTTAGQGTFVIVAEFEVRPEAIDLVVSRQVRRLTRAHG